MASLGTSHKWLTDVYAGKNTYIKNVQYNKLILDMTIQLWLQNMENMLGLYDTSLSLSFLDEFTDAYFR